MADIIDYDIEDNEFSTNNEEPDKDNKRERSPINIKRKGRGFEKGEYFFRINLSYI